MLYECVCALLAVEDVLLLEAAADVDAEASVPPASTPLAATLRRALSLRRENGRNVTSFRAWPLWPATWVELGGSAPHQCR